MPLIDKLSRRQLVYARRQVVNPQPKILGKQVKFQCSRACRLVSHKLFVDPTKIFSPLLQDSTRPFPLRDLLGNGFALLVHTSVGAGDGLTVHLAKSDLQQVALKSSEVLEKVFKLPLCGFYDLRHGVGCASIIGATELKMI